MNFAKLTDKLQSSVPLSKNTKLNLILKAFGIFKIPLLLFTNPKVIEMTDERSELKVALGFRTQNHLGVMYFGALAIGAELSVGLKLVEQIMESKKKIDFLFKDFKIEFLKRADGDVHFICEEVSKVVAIIEKAKHTGDRLEEHFVGFARVPSSKTPDEPVARYELTVSLKNRSFKTHS